MVMVNGEWLGFAVVAAAVLSLIPQGPLNSTNLKNP